jgi:hypothetical protein
MYIYRSMADGIPREHEEALDENMRVIEVEGKPTAVLGIRYKAATDAPPPIGTARTASGKLADTGPVTDELEPQEYWADRPSGICGGTRLTSTFREELVVSLERVQSAQLSSVFLGRQRESRCIWLCAEYVACFVGEQAGNQQRMEYVQKRSSGSCCSLLANVRNARHRPISGRLRGTLSDTYCLLMSARTSLMLSVRNPYFSYLLVCAVVFTGRLHTTFGFECA